MIRLDPGNAFAFTARGAAYAKKGNYEGAIVDFDDAIRIDPHYTWAIKLRAEIIAGKNELGGVTIEKKHKPKKWIIIASIFGLIVISAWLALPHLAIF